jgi:hypothetical protein
MAEPDILPVHILQGMFEGRPNDLPPFELLQRAVNAVFWSSLSKEEGRPSLARLRFSEASDPACQLEAVELSPASLRKLSPLLDASSQALLVDRSGKIVGIGTSGDIAVVATRPGRLAILRSGVVLGVLEEGEWVIPGGNRINVVVELTRFMVGETRFERPFKAEILVNLAKRARDSARGAAFIVIPASSMGGIGTIQHRVSRYSALPATLAAWLTARENTPPPKIREQTSQMAKACFAVISAGAGMDGATIIDARTFRLLGFGAKVNASGTGGEVHLIDLPSSTESMVRVENLGGMRHQSAARLVQTNRSAVVITVSQDGPVSLFAWDLTASRVIQLKHLDCYFEDDH